MAGGLFECLAKLFIRDGVPEYIHLGNGSEVTAAMIHSWLKRLGVRTLFIEPGTPWQNGYNGSVNGTLCVQGGIFYIFSEAKLLVLKRRLNTTCSSRIAH